MTCLFFSCFESYANEFSVVPQERPNPYFSKIIKVDSKTILVEKKVGEVNFQIWDVTQETNVSLLRTVDLGYKSNDFTILPDSPYLVTSNDYTLDFWNIKTGQRIKRTIKASNERIRFIEYIPKLGAIFTTHSNGEVIKWGLKIDRLASSIEVDLLPGKIDLETQLVVDTKTTQNYFFAITPEEIHTFDIVTGEKVSSYRFRAQTETSIAISKQEDKFYIIGLSQPYKVDQILEYGKIENGKLEYSNHIVIEDPSYRPGYTFLEQHWSGLQLSSTTNNLLIVSRGYIFEFDPTIQKIVISSKFCGKQIAQSDSSYPAVIGIGGEGICFYKGLESTNESKADIFSSIVSNQKEFVVHTKAGELKKFSGKSGKQISSVPVKQWLPYQSYTSLAYSSDDNTIGVVATRFELDNIIINFASFENSKLTKIHFESHKLPIPIYRALVTHKQSNDKLAVSRDGKTFAFPINKSDIFLSYGGITKTINLPPEQSIEDVFIDPDTNHIFILILDHTGFGFSNQIIELFLQNGRIETIIHDDIGNGDSLRFLKNTAKGVLAVLISERLASYDRSVENRLVIKRINIETGNIASEKTIYQSDSLINILEVQSTYAHIEDAKGRNFIDLKTANFIPINSSTCPPLFRGTYLWVERPARIVCVSNTSLEIHNKDSTKLSTTIFFGQSGWATIANAGHFVSSNPEGLGKEYEIPVKIVSGLDSFGVGQAFQTLYDPSLVEAILSSGDRSNPRLLPSISLGSLIKDGAPPTFEIVKHNVNGVFFDVELSVNNIGGGLGNARVKLNGRNLELPARISGSSTVVLKDIPLGNMINKVSISLSNEAGSIWSTPRELIVNLDEKTNLSDQRLYIFTIGINDYHQSGYSLDYAINDQNLILDTFKNAKSEKTGFSDVIPIVLTGDKDTLITKNLIGETFKKISNWRGDKAIRPHDVFIFHISGHGYTVDRNYYFLPQNFKISVGAVQASVREQGISQQQWTDWLNGIAAQKSLLLFDTCQSGELSKILGRDQSAFDKFSRNLTLTSGRTLIAASGPQDVALEGYRGHGVLSYSFVESLGAVNSPDGITTRHIQKHIENRVPQITANLTRFDPSYSKHGPYEQKPSIVRNGFDFVVTKEKIGKLPTPESLPPQGIFISNADLDIFDSPDGRVIRTLKKYSGVRITNLKGDWVLISRFGENIGFTKFSDLTRVN